MKEAKKISDEMIELKKRLSDAISKGFPEDRLQIIREKIRLFEETLKNIKK